MHLAPAPSSTGQPLPAEEYRTTNKDAYIEETLSHIRDEDLPADVKEFHEACLPKVDYNRLLRAAKVAKNPKTYQDISRGRRNPDNAGLVDLSDEEKEALCEEQDSVFSERGMLIIVFTVSLAAFLQGHVQSSINGASLYSDILDLCQIDTQDAKDVDLAKAADPRWCDWALGATNATPFFAAAALGCWLAFPISDRFGRKGSMVVAAVLVLLSSLASAIIPVISMPVAKWKILLVIRIVNGIGMGIKAVNTSILASETAIGYWRGTSILAWQLWVAFGIFVGFAFNAWFSIANNRNFALALILGAPIIASIILLLALIVCPESPRWYMRRGPNYNPQNAYTILKSLRKCELIAMRDIYLLHKSIEQEYLQAQGEQLSTRDFARYMRVDKYNSFSNFFQQYRELFSRLRLRNALISSSIVALAQQLCGINILAFYSGTLFVQILSGGHDRDQITRLAMYFSIGFGAINFIFGIPAFRTIDTIGRRKRLTITLVLMALLMAAASLSFLPVIHDKASSHTTAALAAVFLYLHAALYSSGLGPIPFTLAAESFPLAHREVGCAFAISVNFFFAGILSMCFPGINAAFSPAGSLGAFAGFNLLAFVLVFLFVEETRLVSLKDLDFVYAVPKSKFWRFQVFEYLPWLLKRYITYPFYLYVLCKPTHLADLTDPEGLTSRGPPLPPQLYVKRVEEDPPKTGESSESKLDSDDDCA
ncbi:hypothetical protein B0T10DRAFT_610163 [Thelonectria olida]|uniref:Major facilitator superfamily (MFS) profile domain-containing protein n=1 Tax=Thelonectria olida TaxID=1576542 RepID=A0A9P9AKD5_9HYPO|nr:hypothetical protein B0T10DRAFT_610163 [Thelonectria olida]